MQSSPNSPPRVAFFADTFNEANGVATLGRHLAELAKDRGFPFLVVLGGRRNNADCDGSLETLELKRSAVSFPLDKNLYCDPLLTRHKSVVIERLRIFKPDLIHITGPGELGFLGLWVAHILRIPLVASWHTNLHEYLSRRLSRALNLVPEKLRERASSSVEKLSLRGLLRFYQTARFVLAPNQMLVDLLRTRTGRPAFLMPHGVDLAEFKPAPDQRKTDRHNRPFCIGYVGRLTTEKNVRGFVELEQQLLAAGERDFMFLIVGEGGQREWLRKHLQSAEIPGVLRGKELAAAYGRMDAFVFPSRTDTFGLVILEAMASGVSVILTPETGRRVGVEDGISGFLSEDFAASVRQLMHDYPLRSAVSCAARRLAARNSWEMVFEQLYRVYREGLSIEDKRPAEKESKRPRL